MQKRDRKKPKLTVRKVFEQYRTPLNLIEHLFDVLYLLYYINNNNFLQHTDDESSDEERIGEWQMLVSI